VRHTVALFVLPRGAPSVNLDAANITSPPLLHALPRFLHVYLHQQNIRQVQGLVISMICEATSFYILMTAGCQQLYIVQYIWCPSVCWSILAVAAVCCQYSLLCCAEPGCCPSDADHFAAPFVSISISCSAVL
jgi:hypothetical protein